MTTDKGKEPSKKKMVVARLYFEPEFFGWRIDRLSRPELVDNPDYHSADPHGQVKESDLD